jgi:hypothetical protein
MYIQNGHWRIVEIPDMLHITAAEEFFDAIGAVLAAKGAAKAIAPGYLSFNEPGPEKMGLFVLFRDMDKGVDLS